MPYKADMEYCLLLIETHIGEDLTPKWLAEKLGYSFFHFCHIFRICNDVPVGEYIRRRRLQLASTELVQGKKITEIAMDFGYDTPSGFSKAFRKEFGMSAQEYRLGRKGTGELKTKGEVSMEPRLVKKDSFKAIGYAIPPRKGDHINVLESGAYWQGADFSAVSSEVYEQIGKDSGGEIGTWYHPADESGNLIYFFGAIVNESKNVPTGLMALDIPAATYAVFTTEPVDTTKDDLALQAVIRKTWKMIFLEWFEDSEYEFDKERFDFEFYDERCSDREKAMVDIYIPVKRKG